MTGQQRHQAWPCIGSPGSGCRDEASQSRQAAANQTPQMNGGGVVEKEGRREGGDPLVPGTISLFVLGNGPFFLAAEFPCLDVQDEEEAQVH